MIECLFGERNKREINEKSEMVVEKNVRKFMMICDRNLHKKSIKMKTFVVATANFGFPSLLSFRIVSFRSFSLPLCNDCTPSSVNIVAVDKIYT